jgi:hypothetical protein
LRAPADDGSWDSTPTVSIGCGKDNDRGPTARSQDTAPLAQRGHGVRHIHQAKPTEHRIKGSVGKIQSLAVHGAGLDLLQPPFTGDLERELDDAFRNIGRQHVTAGTNSFGGADGRFTCAGGNVQDALIPLNPGQVEHPAGGFAVPAIQYGIPAPPCRAVLVPLLTLRVLVLRCIERQLLFGHASAPLNQTLLLRSAAAQASVTNALLGACVTHNLPPSQFRLDLSLKFLL